MSSANPLRTLENPVRTLLNDLITLDILLADSLSTFPNPES